VVTWTDNSQGVGGATGDGTGLAVKAQVFLADGTRVGPELLVNTATTGNQGTPQVTALSNGGFVVGWQDFSLGAGGATGDASSGAAKAQVFLADGSRVGPEILVNTATTGSQGTPLVTALANGGFVATWSDPSLGAGGATGDNSASAVKAQVFLADGTRVGPEILVNSATPNAQFNQRIVALANGGFVVTWADGSLGVGGAGGDDSSDAVKAQVFLADGTRVGSEILVNSATLNKQAVPQITALPDGGFVVTWQDLSLGVGGAPGDANGNAVKAQAFLADGTRVGAEVLVNTATQGAQAAAQITALSGGSFVVTWEDLSLSVGGATGDSSSSAVKAQVFVIDNPPTISSNGGGDNASVSAAENGTAVTTVTATDPDPGAVLAFSIIGGADAARFQIDASSGVLSFIAAPDFEAPADSDANNSYIVQVRASDGILTDEQTLTVSVTPIPSPGNDGDGNELFDTPFYLSQNPDVAQARVNALDHYNTSGFHEGRDPNPFFDTSFYLAVNQDVAASGVNPLDHFHTIGWRQGRDPSANFDTTLYLIHNPDVAAANIDPLEHFLRFGFFEGREAFAAIGQNIVSGFDAQFYLFHNPDVAAAGIDPLLHYDVAGRFEGRNPNAWFDTPGYLSHYTDVAAAGVNPLQHYETVGWIEGRDPSATFDTLGYLAANPDVAAAQINPLDHFLNNGIYEGRTAINDGLFH
jgi:hypothetical protein